MVATLGRSLNDLKDLIFGVKLPALYARPVADLLRSELHTNLKFGVCGFAAVQPLIYFFLVQGGVKQHLRIWAAAVSTFIALDLAIIFFLADAIDNRKVKFYVLTLPLLATSCIIGGSFAWHFPEISKENLLMLTVLSSGLLGAAENVFACARQIFAPFALAYAVPVTIRFFYRPEFQLHATLTTIFLLTLLALNSLNYRRRQKYYLFQLQLQDEKRLADNIAAELRAKDEKFAIELNFAAEVQSGIFPQSFPPFYAIEFSAAFVPMHTVSGDFYDVIFKDKHAFIILCDVSGHGVPAALITIAVKQAFATAVANYESPADIFRSMNAELVTKIRTQDYLTAFLIRLDDRNNVVYSNAAHQPALHLKYQDRSVSSYDTDGFFIGAVPEAADRYEDKKLILAAGDRIFLYSDGIVEQRNASGSAFGIERLHEIIIQTASFGLQHAVKVITNSVKDFAGSVPIADDISILALNVNPRWGEFVRFYNQALKSIKAADPVRALGNLTTAHEILPAYPRVNYHLARIHAERGDFKEARRHAHLFANAQPLTARDADLGNKLTKRVYA
jgi:serine phosphatase RsbU (regulator of sigma subunit)